MKVFEYLLIILVINLASQSLAMAVDLASPDEDSRPLEDSSADPYMRLTAVGESNKMDRRAMLSASILKGSAPKGYDNGEGGLMMGGVSAAAAGMAPENFNQPPVQNDPPMEVSYTAAYAESVSVDIAGAVEVKPSQDP